jgi:ribosome-binding factor A
MDKQESPRQKKVNTVLQHEIATLLQGAIREESVSNLMVSVTKVNVTSDLTSAKIYLSIFPTESASKYFEGIKANGFQLRHDLSQIMKNQLRRIPELTFFLDDSLDYIDSIEKELIRGDNPIKNPDALESRQKR